MMPPRSLVTNIVRSFPIRSRPLKQWHSKVMMQPRLMQLHSHSSAEEPPAADRSKRPDAKPLGHVSEEKAAVAEAMGEKGPDLSQGTPVESVVKGDKAAQQYLPKVMKDKINSQPLRAGSKGSRSFSTTTQRHVVPDTSMSLVDTQDEMVPLETPGLKFAAPTLPIPSDGHIKHRYDPVVDQVTNLLMRHGKKSVAQRNMALILQHLRTSPVPTINPQRPLLPGAPPPSYLPLNPILYLTLAIDSVAPLLRVRSQRGAAGGGVALQIPVPLGKRQRRRTAVQWILSNVAKKRVVGSGKNSFAQRVGQELIAIVQGTSSTWERRSAIHKLGVAARANIVLPRRR